MRRTVSNQKLWDTASNSVDVSNIQVINRNGNRFGYLKDALFHGQSSHLAIDVLEYNAFFLSLLVAYLSFDLKLFIICVQKKLPFVQFPKIDTYVIYLHLKAGNIL